MTSLISKIWNMQVFGLYVSRITTLWHQREHSFKKLVWPKQAKGKRYNTPNVIKQNYILDFFWGGGVVLFPPLIILSINQKLKKNPKRSLNLKILLKNCTNFAKLFHDWHKISLGPIFKWNKFFNLVSEN